MEWQELKVSLIGEEFAMIDVIRTELKLPAEVT